MYTDLKSIRQAVPGDLNKIRLILKNTKLPFEDIDRHIENFLVLEDAGEIIGTVGMEVYDGAVLLRSLAVIEKFQGKGFGLELYEAIISRAKELHIAQIYLLVLLLPKQQKSSLINKALKKFHETLFRML